MKLTGGLVGCDDTRPSDACIPRGRGKRINATHKRETLRTWVLLDKLMRQKVLRRVLGRARRPFQTYWSHRKHDYKRLVFESIWIATKARNVR